MSTVVYTTPLAQAQADLYVSSDALSLALQRWPLNEEMSVKLRAMNKALWDVKCAQDEAYEKQEPQ